MLKKLLLSLSCIVLISLGAQAPEADIDVVLMVEQNEVEAIQQELEMGLNPNSTLDDLSLLMIAAQMGHQEIVRALIAQEEIDLHARDKFGNTALHFAVLFDHLDVVRVLIYADAQADCSCKDRAHRRFVYQMENGYGKTAADLAQDDYLREMLINPDAYIKSHPQEFREIAQWFQSACPEKAAERTRRLEGWKQKVTRTYEHAKEMAGTAAQKTKSAAKTAYEKTKEVAASTYKKSKKVKQKVDGKMQKAKKYVADRYAKAKAGAANAFDATKEVAAKGFTKTTHAVKRAYQKAKARVL